MLYKIRVYEKGRKKVTIVMTTCNVLGIIEHDFGPLKLEDWDVFKYFSIMLIRDVDSHPPPPKFFFTTVIGIKIAVVFNL